MFQRSFGSFGGGFRKKSTASSDKFQDTCLVRMPPRRWPCSEGEPNKKNRWPKLHQILRGNSTDSQLGNSTDSTDSPRSGFFFRTTPRVFQNGNTGMVSPKGFPTKYLSINSSSSTFLPLDPLVFHWWILGRNWEPTWPDTPNVLLWSWLHNIWTKMETSHIKNLKKKHLDY